MSAAAPAPDGIFGIALPFGYGRVQVVPVVIARPAAAAGFALAVTGVGNLRLQTLSVSLVTDANVANRIVNLDVLDADSNVVCRVPPAGVQAAGLTNQYTWAVGVQPSAPANSLSQIMPLPPLVLQTGWSYAVTIVNAQVADRFGNIGGLVERFITGPLGYRRGQVPAVVDVTE